MNPNIPNLDAMSHEGLMSFWMKHQRGRNRKLLGLVGRNPIKTTEALACYAVNTATAMSCRMNGEMCTARIYESIADRIYEQLPVDVKW